MNRQLINELQSANAQTIADIAERQHHRVTYGEPVSWQAPPSAAPATPSDAEQIAVERMLRDTRGQQTLQVALESMADELGIVTGRIERELRQEIAALREEVAELRAQLAVEAGIQRGQVSPLRRTTKCRMTITIVTISMTSCCESCFACILFAA